MNSIYQIYNNIDSNTINIYITKIKAFVKINISNNKFNITSIEMDGNYLFKVISKILSGIEAYHLNIRDIIYKYFLKNKDSLKKNKYIHDNKEIVIFDECIW